LGAKPTIQEFKTQVYSVVAAIPPGKLITYGQIALLVGYPYHARLVGQVLRQTPKHLRLPCHRVVNSKGGTAPQWPEQRQLLQNEGVAFKTNGNADLHSAQWAFMQL